ncbi:MAG TPA: hypothetical protein VK436_04300 [Methanocella sp.]|nr:hypothetical protein [Methanocella sp.]
MGKRRPLTVEEKAKSYSKYYYYEMEKPNPKIIDKIKQIDPKDALLFKDRNDLLKPGYLKSEYGYCKMPNGDGYVSNLTKMPGVTEEMINWWFAWHGLDPLRYKIWDPEDHFDLQVKEEDRKRLLDPTIPTRERVWGVTHHINEDIGIPWHLNLILRLMRKDPYELVVNFASPSEFGFDTTQFKEPNVATAICGKTGDNHGACQFFRTIEGGLELRTRFWLPAEQKIPLSIIKGLNFHVIKEYTNLAKILPKVYTEESNKPS